MAKPNCGSTPSLHVVSKQTSMTYVLGREPRAIGQGMVSRLFIRSSALPSVRIANKKNRNRSRLEPEALDNRVASAIFGNFQLGEEYHFRPPAKVFGTLINTNQHKSALIGTNQKGWAGSYGI